MWTRNVLSASIASIFILFPISTYQLSTEKFVTLNLSQKLKFDEFKQRVINKMPNEYMREDVYLIRWLRDSNFNVDLAEKRILENNAWRKENRIDSILVEDFSDLEEDYKYSLEGCDKEGKPVISISPGDWDLRKIVLSGQEGRMQRYIVKAYEEAATLILNTNRAGHSNATQFITLLDFGNFNLVTQGCPRCIPILIHLLNTYQQHYPGYAHKVMAINTPQYALPLWQIFRNLLDQSTKDVFAFYGKNSKDWVSSLMQDVDPNQVTKRFGGKRKQPAFDLDEIRDNGLIFKCQ